MELFTDFIGGMFKSIAVDVFHVLCGYTIINVCHVQVDAHEFSFVIQSGTSVSAYTLDETHSCDTE